VDQEIALIEKYISNAEKLINIGNYTEHSFRPMLKELINSLGNDIEVINEPTRKEYGSPDFLILKNEYPVGYIETKKIGVKLDDVEESEQLRKYRQGIPYLILTNYLEFRWYFNGILRMKATLDRNNNSLIKAKKYSDFINLLINFLNVEIEITN
jgi:hypothetical protein